MKLSIVIPAKNEEKYLPRLLQSIKEQTFSDYEVIVADAASTDRTRELAETFGARVVDGGMPGPGRNRGADVAAGELLFFFDADVVLPHPRFLEDTLAEMEARGFDIATCPWVPDPVSTIDTAMYEAYNAFTIATQNVLPHAGGSCILVRRAVHEQLGGFDEGIVFAEDHEYARNIVKLGFRFGVLRSHKLPVSVRRFNKDGRINFTIKCLYSELHMLAKGPFREHLPFDYEFANYTDDETQR